MGSHSAGGGQVHPDSTYDPSGTAWSDPFRAASHVLSASSPNCSERVAEIHHLLENAGITRPYVLTGFSIGGLVGRLYAHKYPDEVAGMVIVDHAFINTGLDAAPQTPVSSSSADSPPVLIFAPPITLGLEDDRNFGRLPQRDQDLHAWAMLNHPLRPTAETAAECIAAVEIATRNKQFPFGKKPLIVIRTNNDLPEYTELQAKLMSLSHNSKQILADRSSHMVIIDEPGVVVSSIREVVESVRKRVPLN